jgi:hypothetical protein
MGAGDFLMSFLGVVIISMGFRIYQQVGGEERYSLQSSTLHCLQTPVNHSEPELEQHPQPKAGCQSTT